MDGKPYQIIAGEMHYARTPPRMLARPPPTKPKAIGLNTIATYVFWNVHEPHPGVYSSLVRTTSPSTFVRPRLKDSTSFSGRARTSAPSGSSAVILHGY